MANKKLIIESQMTIEEKAMALLMCTAQDLTSQMLKDIKHLNLSLTQLQILHALSFSPKWILTVNQIRWAMIEDNPNVSRSINKLVENKYVTKTRDKKDQRVVYIKITETWKKAHKEADKEIMKSSLNLSKEDFETLYKILLKV